MATTAIKKTAGAATQASDESYEEAENKRYQNKEKEQENKGNALLDKMFLNMLKDIYWAEQHLIPHLEEMQKNATTEELQDAIEDHILQTKKHVSRLERVFKSLGEEAAGKNVMLWKGLLKKQKAS